MPRIDNNTYQELTPYMELCEKLGSFISQAVNGKIQEIEIVYSGELVKSTILKYYPELLSKVQ